MVTSVCGYFRSLDDSFVQLGDLSASKMIHRSMVHRSKVGSTVASFTGAHLARGKIKSVEHVLSWSLDSKQLPLPLSLKCGYCIIMF